MPVFIDQCSNFHFHWAYATDNRYQLYCGCHVLGSLYKVPGTDDTWVWREDDGVFCHGLYPNGNSADTLAYMSLDKAKSTIEFKWSKFLGGLAIELLAPEKETLPPAQPLCKFSWASGYTAWGKEYHRLMCNFDSVGSLNPLPEGRVGWRWEPSAHACSPGAIPDFVRCDYCGRNTTDLLPFDFFGRRVSHLSYVEPRLFSIKL